MSAVGRPELVRYLDLKLAANGYQHAVGDSELLTIAHDLLESYREKSRLLRGHLCPPDRRIQDFLDRHFADLPAAERPRLPGSTLMLDRSGLARLIALPSDRDEFHTPLLSSYRTRQGVLHNPRSDRRTTAGSFHIAEGGLPVPGDKKAVPKPAFARLFAAAFAAPEADTVIPWTAGRADPAHAWLSLLLRPLVRPAVPSPDPLAAAPARSLEIRCFAPGTLASNLDFLEAIFGNAGNPHLPANDAGLDIDHWTGHSGCIVFAPHLTACRKRDLGLPHADQATPRQRRDGMCWADADERYNDGQPFKITCRDRDGVMVTLIADNYFGYGKKEVKTQISFAANLGGQAEEEHAGGALAFASSALGDVFQSSPPAGSATWDDVVREQGHLMELRAEGYGVDRRFPDLLYVPGDARFDLHAQRVSWTQAGATRSIALRRGRTYLLPSGFKVRLERHPAGASWRLVGTQAEGTVCHKPCTVSGGGKSEISKSIADAVIYGPLFVNDLHADLDQVEALIRRDYSDRFLPAFRPDYAKRAHRGLLSGERSLGSVIKLFTPSPVEFTPEFNAWLRSIPTRILTLLFAVKRFHRPEWGDDWRRHFTVDEVNGSPGHQLKVDNRPIHASYLRVGSGDDGGWRVFKLRQDFVAADKVQLEDDITASTVVATAALPPGAVSARGPASVKLVQNCERRLFQRPDDAIHRGQDVQAELDLAGGTAGVDGVFTSNFQPIDRAGARALIDDDIGFVRWTAPMRELIAKHAAAADGPQFVVSSAHPRLVDGKPSKNPRYLQERPDLVDARGAWLAEVGVRLARRLPAATPALWAVDAVLPGRRNNRPDAATGVPPLCCYGPIHWLEMPELLMEWASSLTGKSPSTTGAGSEGALTKGPFNALDAVIDLDNAFVAMALCGYDAFTSSAACIGPHLRVDHDISLLIPEIWARLPADERSAERLLREGHLEPLKDFDHRGRRVRASRLGHRITARFVHAYLGKVFDNPATVFTEAMLRPETQDADVFADSVDVIVAAQQRCAQSLLDDGAARVASPPLVAVLDVMATGKEPAPGWRAQFTRAAVLGADWYQARLRAQQERDQALWTRHVRALEEFLARDSHAQEAARLGLPDRLARARARLAAVGTPAYRAALAGGIGLHPAAWGARATASG